MKWRWGGLFLGLLGLCFFALPSSAYVRAPLSLEALLHVSKWICVAKVEQFFPEKPALVLSVQEDLKGTFTHKRLPVVIKLDPKAENENYLPPILKRLAVGRDVILFLYQRDEKFTGLGCMNGAWFDLVGQAADKDRQVWSLLYGQPNLRKTFKGTTPELRQLILDCLAGKKTPPPANEKEPPGFGPESSKSGERSTNSGERAANARRSPHAVFAVIPTLGIGGPLAILAILFPTVFGGVLLLFRQWLAFLTVVSVNSTLVVLFLYLGSYLRGSWWGSEAALWFEMTLVTFLGTLWAWRRQVRAVLVNSPGLAAPPKAEAVVLWLLTMVGGALTVWLWFSKSLFYVPDYLVMVIAIALGAGVIGRFFRRRLALNGSMEAVMLSAFLLAQLIVSLHYSSWNSVSGDVQGRNQRDVGNANLVQFRWSFKASAPGCFISAPLIDGERIYAAAASPTFRVGTLYCLERASGKKIWEFLGEGDLKNMISSPCIADGRLYIGEGFHDDPDCKLWCVDALTGAFVWSFPTKGQTESSPAVAFGKVYFGAGNDGLYCADALTGKEIWRFPPRGSEGRLLRFGAGPTVVGERAYAVTGVDRNKISSDPGETALICLDSQTGSMIWKTPTRLPGWGAPVVFKGRVFLGLGTGDIFSDGENQKAGEVLCCDAATGHEIWHFPAPNGVLGRPAVDEGNVYFSCRSGDLYCLDQKDGSKRWQTFLDSPIVAAPVLAQRNGRTEHIVAVATRGKLCSLNPADGSIRWTYDLGHLQPHITAVPRLMSADTAAGQTRQIYFAAGLGDPLIGLAVLYCLEERSVPQAAGD